MREPVNEPQLRASIAESIPSLSHVVNSVQDVLEEVYGLSNLKLRRVVNYLWPMTHSTVLRHNFEIGAATGTHFSTDWDINHFKWKKTVFTGEEYDRELRKQQLMLRFHPRRIIQGGRYNFQDLHPVVYVSPEHSRNTQGVSGLDQMLTADRVESLEMITAAVSFFMNANTQYNLSGEMPGTTAAYGQSLIDFYHILGSATGIDSSRLDTAGGGPGRLHLMRTMLGRQGLESAAFEKSMRAVQRGEAPFYNPQASQYTESATVAEGLLYHLIDGANQGIDMNSELREFYRLKGVDKRTYLMHLYMKKSEFGDDRYRQGLQALRTDARSDPRAIKWGHKDSRYV